MTELFVEETVQAPKNVAEYIAVLEASTEDIIEKSDVLAVLAGFPKGSKGSGQRRGQLAGLTLDQMSDEQLKREIVNANSVLYKATQRGAAEDTIARNQTRVDNALAEKAARTPEVAVTEDAATTDGVYEEGIDLETANEL